MLCQGGGPLWGPLILVKLKTNNQTGLVIINLLFVQVVNINSLRAMFGADLTMNAVHGSSDPVKAKDAIKMIFGDVELDALVSKSPPADGWLIVTTTFDYIRLYCS